MAVSVYLVKINFPTFYDWFVLRDSLGTDWYYRLHRDGAMVVQDTAFDDPLSNGLRQAASLNPSTPLHYIRMDDGETPTPNVTYLFPNPDDGQLQIDPTPPAGNEWIALTGLILRCEQPGDRYRIRPNVDEYLETTAESSVAATEELNFSSGSLAPVFDGKFWEPRVLSPINVEWNLFREPRTILGGTARPRFGALDISLGDAANDSLSSFSWDSRPIVVYKGEDGQAFGAFTEIIQARSTTARWNYDVLSISISDLAADLVAKSLEAGIYAGSGGVEGDESLRGVRKPLSYGEVINILPQIVNRTAQIYQVHDGPIQAVNAVFDRALPLASVGDISTLGVSSLLDNFTLAGGQYATDLANGLFKLGAPPAGVLTADVQGDNSGSQGYATTASTILRKIAVKIGELVDPTDLDTAAFSALETANSAQISYHAPAGNALTIADAFNEICRTVGAFWGTNDANKLRVKVVDFGTSVRTIEEHQWLDIQFSEAVDAPIYHIQTGYQRAWTVQTEDELSTAATGARRGVQTQDFRRPLPVINLDVLERRPLARRLVRDTLFRTEADAIAEGDRLFTLMSVDREEVRITGLRDAAFTLAIGDTVTLKLPRHGLSAGKNYIVRGRVESPNELVDLVLWG